MVEGSYAHVGNNFALTFHDESLRDVQPLYETTTQAWARSYQESVYVRPTDSIDVMSSYFLPGVGGGDHAFKFGFKYRNDGALTQNMYGGDAYARVTNGAPVEAQIYRRGNYNYELHNRNFYVQDTYSRKKLTLIARPPLRLPDATARDRRPVSMRRRFYGQPTYAGVYKGVTYAGAPFNQLPALSFGGKDGRRGLQELLAARRRHLRPDRQRPERGEVQLRQVRRAARQRRPRVRLQHGRDDLRPLPVGGRQQRQVHPGERGRPDGRPAQLDERLQLQEPVADHHHGHDRPGPRRRAAPTRSCSASTSRSATTSP